VRNFTDLKMANQKSPRQKMLQALPIWTTQNSDIVNLVFQDFMSKLGITDVPSYFRRLRIPIAISVVVCALMGASEFGVKGFVLGGVLGLFAPIILLWLVLLLTGIAIYLVLFCIAAAVCWGFLWWFFSELLHF
jgi:hypothetical protein